MANEAPENLRYFSEEARALMEGHKRRSFDGGGGGGYDQPMEERVKKLEDLVSKTVERVVNIERDVAVMRSNYATKEDIKGIAVDLHKELSAQTWKLVTFVCGFGGALVAATYYIAKH